MKKLLIVATALVLAGLTQAATVQWQVSGSAASAGQTAYLVLNSNLPEANPPALSDITGAAFASGQIALSGRVYIAKGTTDVDDVSAGSSAGYTIFFVDEASNSYLQGGTGTVTGYGATDNPVDATPASSTYTAPGGAGWKEAAAVPEPTALALIALGVAALGLRRKVA